MVSRDADNDVMEQKRQELEDSLRDITEQADNWWDRPE